MTPIPKGKKTTTDFFSEKKFVNDDPPYCLLSVTAPIGMLLPGISQSILRRVFLIKSANEAEISVTLRHSFGGKIIKIAISRMCRFQISLTRRTRHSSRRKSVRSGQRPNWGQLVTFRIFRPFRDSKCTLGYLKALNLNLVSRNDPEDDFSNLIFLYLACVGRLYIRQLNLWSVHIQTMKTNPSECTLPISSNTMHHFLSPHYKSCMW